LTGADITEPAIIELSYHNPTETEDKAA
jgi:hypothetical protein